MQDSGISAILSGLSVNRQCTIEITNDCTKYNLCDPGEQMINGYCSEPLPPQIDPSASATAKYTKTAGAARGAVGVFTYDIDKKTSQESTANEKIAVMFSVPFNYSLFSNWYAVGIFREDTRCDKGLFHLMYYEKSKEFTRGKAGGSSLTHKSDQITIMATMSDACESIIKVRVLENQNKKTGKDKC